MHLPAQVSVPDVPTPEGERLHDAVWNNVMSPKAGVILGMANDRGNPRAPEDSSAIAWWEWRKSILTEDESASDFSDLSSWWRTYIINGNTKAVAGEALASIGKTTESATFTAEDTRLAHNPFWAMLGTPNGKPILRFLTDYKKSCKFIDGPRLC